ncbi:MAG TPA: sigma-70 family RNA polymerase sigma factor [Solirubrobacterales bacterium]|nr:sigma-70 family RNA polymerase sigma factor [Solirubrobacterales bacterium]
MGLTSDGANTIGAVRLDGGGAPTGAAARKRAAVELIARHGAALRKTARRYSLCEEDAEDAYQRTLEILIEKAPSDRARELFGWSKTVIKHEALAIRRNRERLLGTPPPGPESEGSDWTELIPTGADGPGEQVERRERVARGREALRALKPAELRALTLLAEGYSYAEIGEITGFSQTKVNRCLAEGRERFRELVSRSEDGTRCAEMGPLLSAFCDAETNAEQTAEVREHLRACASCRAAMRTYRTAPATVAALAPALPASRSLLEKAQELFLGIQSRLPGAGGAADASVAQVAAAGGTKGAGMAALAKLLAVCAGTAGGAAACVATGVAPAPVDLTPDRVAAPTVARVSERVLEQPAPAVEYEPAPDPPGDSQATRGAVEREPREAAEPASSEVQEEVVETGAVEFAEPEPAPSAPANAPSSEEQSESSGSAAGEFGP